MKNKENLDRYLSNLAVLVTKTHNLHWNVVGADARKIREVAAAEDDFTISNLMEDHVAYYVKQLWFLEAMSK